MKIVDENGWLGKRWGWLFSVGGLLLAFIPWFFDISTWIQLLLFGIGLPISLIGSYEAKAKQFGFPAPFTNDPLGWRKAKKTYKTDAASEDVTKKDEQA